MIFKDILAVLNDISADVPIDSDVLVMTVDGTELAIRSVLPVRVGGGTVIVIRTRTSL